MGTGKTTWAINELFKEKADCNILYLAPTLDEDERIRQNSTREFYLPQNRGSGKLGNIAKLIESGVDIASTHELFRRFDRKCKEALTHNKYILVLDETLTAVEQYHFQAKQDFLYLLENKDIEVTRDGLIQWVGSELDTRFDDVRTLAKNKCLFRVDDKFFLWHFPVEVFSLFEDVYLLTYNFNGSLMAPYFQLYGIKYNVKSIKEVNGEHILTDYYKPDKTQYKQRIQVYRGELNNIGETDNTLSATWTKAKYYADKRKILKNNLYNFARHKIDVPSNNIIWTCFKSAKKELEGKGYARRFLPCNARATNDYREATCLMYAANIYVCPEITKFFNQHGIEIDQDAIALNTLLQWIWRSNIREPDSDNIINLYLPAPRMRRLFNQWLAS